MWFSVVCCCLLLLIVLLVACLSLLVAVFDFCVFDVYSFFIFVCLSCVVRYLLLFVDC